MSPTNLAYLSIFLLSRLSVIWLLFIITGGSEVASDIDFYRQMTSEPLGILLGNQNPWVASYAPLQFLFTTPLHAFFSLFFSEFWTYRLIMLTAEAVGVVCLLLIAESRFKTAPQTQTHPSLLKSAIILSPTLLFSSSIFVQDETICFMFVCLAMLFLYFDRTKSAIFLLCLGVLMGKVFLIVPVFYIAFFHAKSLQSILLTFSIPAVYTIVIWNALSQGGHLPLVGFNPSAEYGSSYWTLLLNTFSQSTDEIKRFSLLLTIAIQILISIYVFWRCFVRKSPVSSWWLMATPLLMFFFTLYQHNAEYLLLVLPPLFLLVRTNTQLIAISFVCAFAWLPRILFGLLGIGGQEASTFETRNRLLGPLVEKLPFNLEMAHQICIVAYSLMMLLMLLTLFLSNNNHPTRAQGHGEYTR